MNQVRLEVECKDVETVRKVSKCLNEALDIILEQEYGFVNVTIQTSIDRGH